MHGINFKHNVPGEGFHITDYPDAAHLGALSGDKAQLVADYALHRLDLTNAKQCLEQTTNSNLDYFTQSTFWRMAIINYYRCFKGNNARPTNLIITDYITEPDGIEAHKYFLLLRDKNVAHDDNALSQCLPGVIVNKADAPHKIEKIITFTVAAEVYTEGNIHNLNRLIQEALQHVSVQYDQACDELTNQMEKLPHTELLNLPALEYKKPTEDNHVAKSRPRHRTNDTK